MYLQQTGFQIGRCGFLTAWIYQTHVIIPRSNLRDGNCLNQDYPDYQDYVLSVQ